MVSTSTSGRTIRARAMAFDFPPETPREWVRDDPYATTLMNALSLTFPEGESFFVASVRALRKNVKDPVLAQHVQGFLAQESLHRREHGAFNEWLRTQGVDVDAYYARVSELLAQPLENGTPMSRLALTCALEHFTAILARGLLTDEAFPRDVHDDVRPLWTWHAIEELDHKAVAFDVYRESGGTYLMRALVMAAVTVGFISQVTRIQLSLIARDRQFQRPVPLLRGALRCWGPKGVLTRLVPAYLRYFHPRFHPDQVDESALIAQFEHELAAYSAERSRAAAA